MIERLIDRIREKKAPIVVGLDPQPAFLPEKLQKEMFAEYGTTPEAIGHALVHFNKSIVDAVADLVPAVKPQIAMYEQFGISGLFAYRETIRYCKEKGLIVIGDVKRGDIGSTSAAYATAHLGKVQVGFESYAPFDEDMATVNPYLGSDGIRPFVEVCKKEDRGIFVLVKTSNPSSGEFQDLMVDGKPLYQIVGEKVEEWGEPLRHGSYSDVGAVVGATYPQVGRLMRSVMKHTFILVPGYGAQGGTAEDLKPYFDEDGLGAIVNSSRGIIAAYQNEKYASYGEEGFADAARAAVLDMKEDITRVIGWS